MIMSPAIAVANASFVNVPAPQARTTTGPSQDPETSLVDKLASLVKGQFRGL